MNKKPENVKCPLCGGPMVSRQNRATGQRFWGCTFYPNCRGTRDTDGLSPAERRQRTWSEIGEHPGSDDEMYEIGHPGHPSNYGDN